MARCVPQAVTYFFSDRNFVASRHTSLLYEKMKPVSVMSAFFTFLSYRCHYVFLLIIYVFLFM
ncbi:hypothetical protein CSC12_1497 [Klebsiella michiganensis]|nr:hypothetical protein CSC12_1497 [Klebsiella michiganensis]